MHVFDMDGTLLRGTTASLHLAGRLGTVAELRELEAGFASGRLDTRGFAAELRALWHDLTPELVAAAFRDAPWLDGIAEVCADIRARGEHSAVITMSPDFFARHLLDLGVDDVVASRFPALPFREPLDPAGILDPDAKVRVTGELCARHGLDLERVVAYGDSMSDAPLFRQVRRTVAVNADHHVAGLAAVSYQGTDLRAVYALGRALASTS
ncbi:hypothetical protein GCM10027589_43380 [Actinocorallia lasiicapitis]